MDAEGKKQETTSAPGSPPERGSMVVRWERFLPRRSVRVLLVENDDCTRNIVSALLKKCGYHVSAVADSLKAWEILKEKHYNFDLVLTEVVMPSLSGIVLLSKIMSTDMCKNIPVIMMSSHDSMGLVFNCMQKGASDFLLKPVRKNELRNLWQHVWRKCNTSIIGNAPASEYGNRLNLEAGSGDNAASNNARRKMVPDCELGDYCQSETQSSCSKSGTEVESLRYEDEALQTENISLNIENSTQMKKCDSGKTGETAASRHNNDQKEDDIPCVKDDQGPSAFTERANFTLRTAKELIDFIGRIDANECSNTAVENHIQMKGETNGNKNIPSHKKSTKYESPQLSDLSSKMPPCKDPDEKLFSEKHVLKHSDGSAFSRYSGTVRSQCPRSAPPSSLHFQTRVCNVKSNSLSGPCPISTGKSSDCPNQAPHCPYESSSLLHREIGSGGKKEELDPSMGNEFRDGVHGTPCDNERLSSDSQQNVVSIPVHIAPVPFHGIGTGYSGALQPIFYSEESSDVGSSSNRPSIEIATDGCGSDTFDRNQVLHQSKQRTRDEGPRIQQSDDIIVHDLDNGRQSCSNPCSLIGSGGNGSNDNMNTSSRLGVCLVTLNEEKTQSCSEMGFDQDRSRREAALAKFRLKRKDRCFEKKVRYHSRKMLAEQRPRVKGQFVRQIAVQSTTEPDH